MARLKWTDDYSVNISSVDLQHQKLFEIINSFYNSLKEKHNKDALLIAIIELKRYTVYHFDTEEALMKQYNFIGLRKHKEEHDIFRKKIEEVEKNVTQGKMVLSLSITGFLETWIKSHIQGSDEAYSKFLTSRGVM